MRVDTNTCGHRQWFYFSIKCKSKRTLKLNIYRFKKPYSLYQRGMRPYVKSVRSQQQQWLPGGYNVRYIRQKQVNDYGVKKPSLFYYLTFMYQFQHDEDQVFFAAGIPYTYSFLTERLLGFQSQSKKSTTTKLTQLSLGLTPCGLSIYMVKLEPKNLIQNQPKHIVVINCRTHPGETSPSWVLDGLINFLLSLSQSQSQIFAQHNICFHILPMLNPDGVFLGNYRTGIVGDDFNRKFSTGRKDVFSEINCLKKMINSSKKQGKLIMFVDLHGHSILKNSFIYGPSQIDFTNYTLRKLPFNLWHKSQYFRLSSCRFQTDSSKIQTARMYFQFKEGILSYTCQNSLGLYESSNGHTYQMTKQDWRKFGADIIEGIKETIQSEEKLIFYDNSKEEEDLLSTNPPPIKQSSRLPINKRVQVSTKLKLKTQKNLSLSNNQSVNLNTLQDQNTSKSISNTEKVSMKNIRSRKFQSPFFSSPNKQSPSSFTVGKEQCKNAIVQKNDGKATQIRRRLPSLESRKEGRSRQGTNGQLRSSVKDVRQKIDIFKLKQQTSRKFTQKDRNNNGYVFALMTSSQPLPNQQLHSSKNSPKHLLNQYNPDPKREFIESIYSKRQLKQLRNSNGNKKDKFSLGSKLTPVMENINIRLQRKNQGERSNVNVHSVKMLSSTAQVTSNQTMINSRSPFNQLQTPIKKQQCDFKDDKLHSSTGISNKFDNIQISLSSQMSFKQRSRTYDESYLQWQIEKLKQMKQTQRQYEEQNDQELKPWKGDGFHLQNLGCEINDNGNQTNNKLLFDDRFSQQYNDELNDSDSQSQDLPQQKRTHVLQYIRSHNHLGQRLRGVYVSGVNNKSQNGQQNKINGGKEVENERMNTSSTKPNNSRKRNINAFREIVFAHGEYFHEPIDVVTSNIESSFINDDRTTRWNNSAYFSTNVNINGNIPKLRKNPHKFKQSLGNIKFNSLASKLQASQKDNVGNQDSIYLTHKKKLNERNMRRQSRKDPFILVSRKQKPLLVGKGYPNH